MIHSVFDILCYLKGQLTRITSFSIIPVGVSEKLYNYLTLNIFSEY